MTDPRIHEAIPIAERIVPLAPDPTRSDALHRSCVVVGVVYEAAYPRPTVNDLAAAFRMKRSNVVYRLQAWRNLNWEERNGWMTLFRFNWRRA